MTDKTRRITADEAEGLLFEGTDRVHNIGLGRMMIGADWDRSDATQTFRDAVGIWLSDGIAAAMRHQIVVREPSGRFSGFEADPDKVAAFEASHFGRAEARA